MQRRHRVEASGGYSHELHRLRFAWAALDAAAEVSPELMTVEEAAEYLRVSRALGYQLARQYRLSRGDAGLPVLELGRCLRVPRSQLAELVGVRLDAGGSEREVFTGHSLFVKAAMAAFPAQRTRPDESPCQCYSMRIPEMARLITSCWICSVPSKMS